MARIGFLGLGAMGSRMATRLIAAGHELHVWNRTAANAEALRGLGATVCSTPRQAALDAQYVISMVRDDESSRAIWLDNGTGALHAMGEGSVAIECSTLSTTWVSTLADIARDSSVRFLDAPVVGSRPQAQAGQLIFLVGGDSAVVGEVVPTLRLMGSKVLPVGPCGHGMAVKLAVNSLFATQVAVLSEILASLRRNGIDPALAVSLIAETPVCSPAARIAGEMIASNRHDPLFPAALAQKDLAYFLDGSGGVLPVIRGVNRRYEELLAASHGDRHLTAVALLYEQHQAVNTTVNSL
jgi:3-hydroxyisobutyrate dehydrogenase